MGTSSRLLFSVFAGTLAFAADESAANAPGAFRQYCFQCHGKASTGGISFDKLMAQPSMGDHFQQWEKIAAAIESKQMPPAKMAQPSDADRTAAVSWIRTKLTDISARHAGDPGKVTVRRLTSGEYAYSIKDLTGIDINTQRDFVSDSVGGEGFANFGDVQFMADASLERYLQAAKLVANHAVIGSGPLQFYSDPGRTGFEFSALNRIQNIYTTYGFRAASGEGGRPFGLDRYGKALFASWQFKHRAALGEPNISLAQLAAREGITTRFTEHIWTVLNQPSPAYPASEVISRFNKLGVSKDFANVRKETTSIQKFLVDWPRWLFGAGALAEGGLGDERALVLTEESLAATPKQKLRFNVVNRSGKLSAIHISTAAVNPESADQPIVVLKNATIRFRMADRALGQPQPLLAVLDDATKASLAFGKRPDGGAIDPLDFAMTGSGQISLGLKVPENARGVDFQAEAEIVSGPAQDAVLRCTVSDRPELSSGRPISVLLGNPKTPGFDRWKAGVLAFADQLPQNSNSEAAPSDKDPIPAPYDNTYNQPERDDFHIKLKYYRSDRFLVDKMLDDATRRRLDQAWSDILSSFAYHDIFLKFVAQKYKYDLGKKSISDMSPAQIAAMPADARPYVAALKAEYDAVQKTQQAAHPGHIEDALRLASQAWRRPLTATEKDRLRRFYTESREVAKLDHPKAVRALLTRVLVAPSFLYRLEQPTNASGISALSNSDLASRLSYFLWSSIPDEELRRADLSNNVQLAAQVKRMLADPKARRLSTEFFGQWLGFYRFDNYKGVDPTRFPEFTDDVRAAMYDESVSFFEHIIRKERPVRELLFADYTFLNQPLAKHYGLETKGKPEREVALVTGAPNRGGLLRLGSVLTVTSAPLRTSPVKRGDWLLRRILGTPTPPPPADAGSIPADDKAFAGQTLRERLDSHKRNATCASCHNRIDPMGFPLESFDPVGRHRATYSDGKPVDDGGEYKGYAGLLQYLKTQEKQVRKTMAQKLLGFALGRTMLASDQPLIDRLVAAGDEATMTQLITEIVSSKQFRNRQEPDANHSLAAQTRRTPQ